MIYLQHKKQAIKGRRFSSSGTGKDHWRTDYLIPKEQAPDQTTIDPQVFMIEMTPGEVIMPHFHEVEQYQIFVDGAGTMGRNQPESHAVTVHYTDHSTGYGPIVAGSQGYSYFAMRPRRDSGAVYLHKPGYRERLRPSPKHHFTKQVTLTTEPVLLNLNAPQVQSLLDEQEQTADGLSSFVIRLGANQKLTAPSASNTGGQYLLVVRGNCHINSTQADHWSVGFVTPDEPPVELTAGTDGAEIIAVSFRKNH